MRNYQRLAQPTSTLLKQALVLGVAMYCAITLLPFIKYKSGGTPQTHFSSASPSLTSVDADDFSSMRLQKGSRLTSEEKSVQHFNQQSLNKKADALSSKTDSLNMAFLPRPCRLPNIPSISITAESETRTIHEINAWITCHNDWSKDLQSRLVAPGNTNRQAQAQEKTKLVIQNLLSEDQKQLEDVSHKYAEWKRNSLSYKQRLGFRRSLMSENDLKQAQ